MEHRPPLIDLSAHGIPLATTYEWIALLVLAGLCLMATRNLKLVPGRGQALIEWMYFGVRGHFDRIIGEAHGSQYTTFCMALFFYILIMNLLGLVPGFKSPTEVFSNNVTLALLVFFYTQFTAISHRGIKGFLFHLAGSPRDITTILMVPLMFPVHLTTELIRPLTLSLRLFGNIFGEEVVIGMFFTFVPLVLPVPFMLLAVLTSFIQALIFSTLTAVYFQLALADH